MLMRRFFLTLLFLLVIVSGADKALAVDPPFDELQWRANVIVLTGPERDPLYIEQFELLEGAVDELNAYDIIVIRFEDRTLDTIPALSAFPYKNRVVKERDEQRYLQSQLRTDDDVFSVVLVAKDGSVLNVWKEVTPPADILAVLEARDASNGLAKP